MSQLDDKLKGFEAGVDDYVPKPINAKELLARVRALLNRADQMRATSARTVSLVGAKGGVGVTTSALNIAIGLTQQGHSVILIELRASDGAIRHQLDLENANDLGRLLSMEPAQIKRPEIERRLTQHSSGLQLLLAPPHNTEHDLTVAHVDIFLDILARRADYVVLDIPPMPGPASQRAFELSDEILLVMEPESMSVGCAQDKVEAFKNWGTFDRVNLLLVNRTPMATALSRVEVENQVGINNGIPESKSRWGTNSIDLDDRGRQRVVATVPAAPEVIHEAVQKRVPIVLVEPGAPVARAWLDVARWLGKQEEDSPVGTINY